MWPKIKERVDVLGGRERKMQKCINCGHDNRSGVLYCENCGVSLSGDALLDTKSIDTTSEEEKNQLGVDESVLTDVRVQGSAIFSEKDLLRLDVEGSSDPIVLKPSAETIFGRRDPATGAMPDVDLTPFAGYRMGVSRRHAALRFGDGQSLDLWDLGSSNGTYLNGERLSAHRPYRVHDGDELRLGQMIIRVRFQPIAVEVVKKEEEPAVEVKPEALQPVEAVIEKPVETVPEPEKPGVVEEVTVGMAAPPITDALEIPETAQKTEEKAEILVAKPAAEQVKSSEEPTPPIPPEKTDTPPSTDEKKRD